MTGLLTFLGVAFGLLVIITAVLTGREMLRPARRSAGWAIARGLPCDPADAGYEYEQWWVDRPKGIRLPVWEITTAGAAEGRHATGAHGSSQAPTIVLVHGWGQGRIDMLGRMLPAWIDRAERFILYDQRGHGESEAPGSNLGDREVDDLLALLEHLGDGPIVLVAYSMGAVVSLAALSEDAEAHRHVAGVFAYAPYADFHESLCARLRQMRLPRRPVTDLALLFHRVRGIRPRSFHGDELARIDVPVTILHGVEDEISPIEHGRFIASHIPGATLHEVRDVGHTLEALLQCDQHDPAAEAFMNRLADRPAQPAASST